MSVTFRHYPGWHTFRYIKRYALKSVTYGNNEKWIWLKGDDMVTNWWLNGHWYVPAIHSTEWWLQGHWMASFSYLWNGGVSSCVNTTNSNKENIRFLKIKSIFIKFLTEDGLFPFWYLELWKYKKMLYRIMFDCKYMYVMFRKYNTFFKQKNPINFHLNTKHTTSLNFP